MSIRQNLTYALELTGEKRKSKLDETVEHSLKLATIWDEVKNGLMTPALHCKMGSSNFYALLV